MGPLLFHCTFCFNIYVLIHDLKAKLAGIYEITGSETFTDRSHCVSWQQSRLNAEFRSFAFYKTQLRPLQQRV